MQTYGITIEHKKEHGKILSHPAPGNLKVNLNSKHDAESIFLSSDLGHVAKKQIQTTKSKQNAVKPSGQKTVGFRHFAKRGFEIKRCSYALKPKKHVQFSKSTVPIKGEIRMIFRNLKICIFGSS